MTASMFNDCDVLIIGGGLAGMSLALQLTQRTADLSIVIAERATYPVPVAAHKVGESTVEIGAHYFAKVLGLEEHLRQDHLCKFGLRFFFGGPNPPMDLAQYDELGASDFLPVTSYQIDRGIFENHLAQTARERGITVLDGCTVHSADCVPGRHRVTLRDASGERSVKARWLVDASGRKAFLKRQLGLERTTAHKNCSVWLRTSAALDVDGWGRGDDWHTRCGEHPRRLSTNHMMGPGYWVWVIPLSSGATSVGLVFDPDLVDVRAVNSYDHLLDWLRSNQPLTAAALEDGAGEIMDFHVLRGYPHDCQRVFSDEQWAMTGEAGVFTDPFYSPGSDFIAMSNTYVARLIQNDLAANGGVKGAGDANYFNQAYRLFFSANLSLFTHQYPGFGDRDLMFAKTTWDYSYYWSVLAKLFFADKITDRQFLEQNQGTLLQALQLNVEVQRCFREAATRRRQLPAEGLFFDQIRIPRFGELNSQLLDDAADPAVRLADNVAQLETLAGGVQALAAGSPDDRSLREAIGFPYG